MAIITIRNLKKKLQEKQILNDINIDINKGEIITLVGPSGSGKTTLLRCINRLIEPDDGSIKIKQKDYQTIPVTELRKQIVLVPQESVMFPGTVKENVSYALQLHHQENGSNIIKSLNDAGLDDHYLSANAEKLSGGEKKRVALARALVLQPEVLLLDEPTSGVDPKKIRTVEKSIIDFTKQRHLTVIWVTHNVDQAKRVSNRIANLKNGMVAIIQNADEFSWEGAY